MPRSRPACWPPRPPSTRVHGRPPARRAHGLPGRLREELAARRAEQGAQLQAVVQEGPDGRHADDRHRAVRAARPHPVDAAPQQARPRAPEAGRRLQADRLSQARRQAHLRPALLGVHQQHQPRGEPAGAPDAEGRRGARPTINLAEVRRPRERATARPASTSSCRRRRRQASACRSTRRTACTARPATSRTRRRTSCGSRPKAAAGRTTWGCRSHCPSLAPGEGCPCCSALPPGEGWGEGTWALICALRFA